MNEENLKEYLKDNYANVDDISDGMTHFIETYVKVYKNGKVVNSGMHKVGIIMNRYFDYEVDVRNITTGELALHLKYQSFNTHYANFNYRKNDFLEIQANQDGDKVRVVIDCLPVE